MPSEMENVEITLVSGQFRLKVSPFGASLRGFWKSADDGSVEEIIIGYTGAKGKVGGQGDVLIPFAGRIGKGHYQYNGQSYQMELNDKEGPNAIHGFLRLVEWEIAEQTERSVSFMTWLNPEDHVGYPFSICASVNYSLDKMGMRCSFTIENIGENSAPAAAGFHPYFTAGTDMINVCSLRIPMKSILEFENLIPTGNILPVEGSEFDFLQPRTINETKFNTCFIDPVRDPDGMLRVQMESASTGRSLQVWMDSAFTSIVIYSGDPLPESHRRKSLAIEPMTCASDAYNHPEWGLINLAPSESFSGSWGVECSG